MKLTYDQLIAQHQNLQKSETAPATAERVEQVKAFIADVVAAGADIAITRQREQLRSILRYWSAWVYDRTKEYPPAQLVPYAEIGAVPRSSFNLTVSWLIGIGTVILIGALAFGIFRGASYGVGPEPSPSTDRPTAISALATVTLQPAPTGTATVPVGPTATSTPTPLLIPTATPLREAGYRFTLTGNTDVVLALAFSPDGRVLASGSRDGYIRIWDITTQSELTSASSGTVLSLAIDKTGQLLLSGGFAGNLRFWNAREECLRNLAQANCLLKRGEQIGDIWASALSRDGKLLATGSTPETIGNIDPTIQLWQVGESGTPVLSTIRFNSVDPVTSLVFTPDGKQLVSGGTNGTILVWDTETGKELRRFERGHRSTIWGLGISPDGRQVASAGEDGTIRIWDFETGRQILMFQDPEPSAFFSLIYNQDGRLLASGGADRVVRFWRASDLTPIGEPLSGHTGAIHSLAFSPSGDVLTSGSADSTIIFWTVPLAP